MTTALKVHAIHPQRLDTMRVQGHDEHGNYWSPYAARGGEPLRCCLRSAAAAESIVLIAYAPFTTSSPWTEVGPVYVHADACEGYDAPDLPSDLRTGPRVLRGYDGDGTLLYDHVHVVDAGQDLNDPLARLLEHDVVSVVHVRALATQCFTYAVSRAD